jgi:amino acid transporter
MGVKPQERTTRRRSLSVWQAVGISVALMAPSMAANINPQGTAGQVGRATPLAFFLAGDLGTSYIGPWVGNLITLGAAVSAFGCCLACVVGASRLLFAISRDLAPGSALARTGSSSTPATAAGVVATVVVLIAVIRALAFGAKPFDMFLWSGTIGTLILLVAFGWLLLVTVVVLVVPGLAHRMSAAFAHLDGDAA